VRVHDAPAALAPIVVDAAVLALRCDIGDLPPSALASVMGLTVWDGGDRRTITVVVDGAATASQVARQGWEVVALTREEVCCADGWKRGAH